MTYISGTTLLIEVGGLRLLTDPTFDPKKTNYITDSVKLSKPPIQQWMFPALDRLMRCCSATIITLAIWTMRVAGS
jgi:L-ascorbate metabolism protein UlaG (beta-lactamase superfamily)